MFQLGKHCCISTTSQRHPKMHSTNLLDDSQFTTIDCPYRPIKKIPLLEQPLAQGSPGSEFQMSVKEETEAW